MFTVRIVLLLSYVNNYVVRSYRFLIVVTRSVTTRTIKACYVIRTCNNLKSEKQIQQANNGSTSAFNISY